MKKLTIAEAAQRANVDARVIKEWIEQGKLDCSRTDKRKQTGPPKQAD